MTDKGGQAFPDFGYNNGMTYRQWLAGLAMNGLLANPNVTSNVAELADAGDTGTDQVIAQIAIHQADGLISELEVT